MPWNSSEGSMTCACFFAAARIRSSVFAMLALMSGPYDVWSAATVSGAFRHQSGSCCVMQWNEPPPASPEPSSPREDMPIDFALPKHILQEQLSAAACVARTVDGHDDDAVRNDEIHVRGRRHFAKRIAIEAGARNAHDIKRFPCGIRRLRQGFRDRVEGRGIGIVGAGGCLADDAARRHEAGDVVDVTIGVVVFQALVDPDDFARAERAVSACSASALVQPLRFGLSSVCCVVRIVPKPS